MNIVSVESASVEVHEHIYKKLIDKLNRSEKPIQTKGTGTELAFREWPHQKVIVPEEVQQMRFPSKGLWSLIEKYIGTGFQVWTRLKLNESALRKLRSSGYLFDCFLVFSEGDQDRDYNELERIIKISQNRPLGAQWIHESEISAFIEGMRNSHQYGLIFPIGTLAKTSSADTPSVETPLSRIMRGYYSKVKNRQIHWYSKQYVHKKMDEEKWGVDPLPKKQQGSVKRHVLVTGTGRSGTTYFSDLLTLLGLDVGHQRNGKDGCSGAEFSMDHDWYPWFPVYGGGDCANVGERRSDYTYKHVLHIVRHPLWCIPSLMKNYPAINPEFWADNGTMDPAVMDGTSIIRNATMYYSINEAIDKSGQAEYRCQLEDIHNHWSNLMSILEMGKVPDPSLKASNQASGWGQYEPLTWNQLEQEVGTTLTKSIRAQANRYGYE